tara:strand:- start:268 stop:897 length:630 start_codon:yes stop_codon:yes gene_type:complete
MDKLEKSSKGRTLSYPEQIDDFFDNISADMIDLWNKAYKDKDVVDEISRAKAWLLSNQNKRYKNLKRFFNNWLNRSNKNYKKNNKVTKPKDALEFSLFKDKWLFEEKFNEEKTKNAWYSVRKTEQELIIKVLPHSMMKYKMELQSGQTELEYIPQAHKYITEKKWNNAKLLESVKRNEWHEKEYLKTIRMRTPEQQAKIREENNKWREE